MVIGQGFAERRLTEAEAREVFASGIERMEASGKRVLVLIPDDTRSGPMASCFRWLVELLAGRASSLDFLVALGTHAPMSDDQLFRHLGITASQRHTVYRSIGLYQHDWRRDLATIAVIPARRIAEITDGHLEREVPVQVNGRILEYDELLVCGPVFPHEAMGFSGGNKYLFPGVSGASVIDCFHWLAALLTNRSVIGRQGNPVRRVVDEAARCIPVRRWCFSLVTAGHDGVHGVYFGSPEESQAAAAALSARVHTVHTGRLFQKVLSVMPARYTDLWTAAKGMYKVEPVVADGGTVVIYAPHVCDISHTHGALLERIGYHVRDYFLARWREYREVPGCILAHSTLVKGDGAYRDGVESARVNVILATGIPQEICQRVNLGYRDPSTICLEEWADREGEGILLVPDAGETLYLP